MSFGSDNFRCVIFGEGGLPQQCGDELLDRGHEIVAVISPDPALRAWCEQKSVAFVEPGYDLAERFSAEPFDYLFSIVNPIILAPELIALPRKWAINYHEGPLPKYAGSNSTSWAIMNGDQTYAVTWQLLAEKVDAGDILVQPRVPLAYNDSAFTLKGKCYEAAGRGFIELLDALEMNAAVPRPQDLSQRTWFPRFKRPDNACIINWSKSADEIEAMLRGLDLGIYPNPLGLPKIAVLPSPLGREAWSEGGPKYVLLSKMEALGSMPAGAPGTINSILDNYLTVASSDAECLISEVRTLDGQHLTIPEFVERYGLSVGSQFSSTETKLFRHSERSEESARSISSTDSALARSEPQCIARLAAAEPLEFPYANRQQINSESAKADLTLTEAGNSIPPAPRFGSHEIAISDPARAYLAAAEAPANEILFTLFSAWVARVCGKDSIDLAVHLPGGPDLKSLESLFVPYAPIHLDMNLDETIAAAAERVRQSAEPIHGRCGLARDLIPRFPELRNRYRSLDGIFSVAAAVTDQPEGVAPLAGAAITLEIARDGSACTLHYDSNLVSEDSAGRIASQLSTMLDGLAANPSESLGNLPILNQSDIEQLFTFNNTTVEYPRDATIHQLFEEQVTQRPDSVAVRFQGEEMTYAELNRRSNQLAHYLRAYGIGPDVRVGVAVNRSFELIVGLLGILKAGGCYVPLDPHYPLDRLSFMFQDSGLAALVTTSDIVDDLPATWGQVVCLDSDWEDIADESGENPTPVATAENLAYLMYTSGSTGQPKGSLIPHRAVVRLVRSGTSPLQGGWGAFAEFGPDETFLQFAPTPFDASTLEIWGPLLNGGKLVIFPPHLASLEELGKTLREEKITTMWLTAGLFHQMVEDHLDDLKGLKQLLAGGDVLSPPHVVKAVKGLPNTTIINGYGPTENTTFTCCYRIPKDFDGSTSVPIGKPISNTQVYILDNRMLPVPIGVPGEIYAAGDGLSRAYHNRPELSTQRFVEASVPDVPNVPNVPPVPSARLYKIGDLARWLPDGNIEFLGRRDTQVKIRGFRIELEEIESVLSQHHGIRRAAVIAREDTPGDKRLVAYIVPENVNEPPAAADLRAILGKKLPDYMIPAAFLVMDFLPLNPNGKVDRRALPVPESGGSDTAATTGAESEEEAKLCKIWAEVLGIKQVGLNDNFFDLGGHSLLATQVITRIRDAFGVELPLQALFEEPTVAGIAKELGVAAPSTGRSAPPIEKADRTPPIPCSFQQQRLWFIDQMEPGSYMYNSPVLLRIKGELDSGVLQDTLDEITTRHEIWRTTFSNVEGLPAQVIHPYGTIPIAEHDARGKSEEETRQILWSEYSKPFDLARLPLVRAALIHTGDSEHLLLFSLHHIVSDGWSIGVMLNELGTIYGAFAANSAMPLLDPPVQYADYAIWQRKWMQGEVLEREVEYWRQKLAGAPEILELPTDRPRPEVISRDGGSVQFEIPDTLATRLRAIGQKEGASLYMVLMAAFQTLLHKYTGNTDIVLGTDTANRSQREVEALLGFFLNHVVMRTDLSGDPAFKTLLTRTRTTALEAFEHQELSFDRLVEALNPERKLSHTPLFQVLFVLQNAPAEPVSPPGIEIHTERFDLGTSKYDLGVFLEEATPPSGGGGVAGELLFKKDLFDEATIERMTGHYLHLLESIASNVGAHLSALEMIGEEEKEKQRLAAEARILAQTGRLKASKRKAVAVSS